MRKAPPACRTCGAPAVTNCTCGAPCCGLCYSTYIDDANHAISRSARPQCIICRPPRFLRPFTLVRAVERGEWFLPA